MASASNPFLLAVVLTLFTSSGCWGERQIYEDPRVVSPKKLKAEHEDSTLASFGVEVISSSPCLNSPKFINAEIKATQFYGLDSCSFEDESTLKIITTENELSDLEAISPDDGVFISFGEYLSPSPSTEEFGCEGAKYINRISLVDDYLPLNESELIFILRGEHDISCSGSI